MSAGSPLLQVHLHHVGGAVGRIAADATAFAHRGSSFALNIIARWTDRADDDGNMGWTRDFAAAIEPYAHGAYVNFLGDEGEGRVRAAYGDRTYARLVAVKTRYDPDNVFRLNQNIRPENRAGP